MLFLRVIVWCGAEKFSLKKSCFYLYIRRRHEPRRNPPADSRRMGTVRTSPQKPYVHQTRNRKSLVGERTRELNRLQKMLEGANIKLSGTVSDINGKSARSILEYLLTGEFIDEAKYDEMYKKLFLPVSTTA